MCIFGGGGQGEEATPDPQQSLPAAPLPPVVPKPLPLPQIRASQQAEEGTRRLKLGRRKLGTKKVKETTLKSLRTTLNTPTPTPPQGINNPTNP